MGRTDLPGADTATLMASIAGLLDRFDDDTVVFPGHMGVTTLGRERATNPFLQSLAALEGLVGVVALERAEARPGHEGHDVGQHAHLDLRAVDRRARRAGHGCHRADVVEVGVGEQDRVETDAELLDRAQQSVGLVAGIDQQRPVRAVAAHEPGVLLDRPDGEAADVHRQLPSAFSRASLAWRRR